MIYFIKDENAGLIKIGTTIRLSQRLKQLAAESGGSLRVLAVTDGNRSEEQALHRRFEALRVVNEWFEPGDDLIGFIVAEGREWDGSDDKPVPDDPRIHVFGIRGREAWKEWLVRFAEYCRSDMVDLVDDSLEAYAKARGFEAPPKR